MNHKVLAMPSENAVFDLLLERVRGHQLAALIHLAVRWDLADRVGQGAEVHALAADLAADPKALARVLRALAGFDIFTVDAGGMVRPTVASSFLMRDAPRSLHAAASFWSLPVCWSTWGDLADALRTGECAFERRVGMPLFEHLAENAEDGATFNRFMSASPESRHAAVVEAIDFTRYATVADIGGGSGQLLRSILDAAPSANGLLFDRADVIDRGGPVLDHLRASGRCEVVRGSFFDRVPSGADAYVLSQILHDWDDDAAGRILSQCRAAAGDGTHLLVVERLLDEHAHPNDRLSDVEMLLLHRSAERTADDYQAMLAESGFAVARVVRTASPFSVIECVPV